MATLATVQDEAQVIPATYRAYAELVKARGEAPFPRYTYFRGRLTIKSPGLDHETVKMRMAAMLGPVFLAMNIPYVSAGSVTLWGGARPRPGTRKGAEPDLCYYLRDIDAVKYKREIVMGVDPPPHLAVEVAVSHNPAESLRVFHKYKVGEVWVCRRGVVEFHRWTPRAGRGRWDLLEVSEAVPCLSAAEVTQWLYDSEDDHGAFLRRFDAWVEAVVRPRLTTSGAS
jgi:Uma2 family endonuclease